MQITEIQLLRIIEEIVRQNLKEGTNYVKQPTNNFVGKNDSQQTEAEKAYQTYKQLRIQANQAYQNYSVNFLKRGIVAKSDKKNQQQTQDKPKERELSGFDKMILKAANYNPKKA